MNERVLNPLFGPPPPRVQLDAAPLVRVLAQVQFAKIVKIAEEKHIGDFQEALRAEYPHLERDEAKSVQVQLDHNGVSASTTDEVIWRLLDASKIWRVSLAQSAITLETASYTSRGDFLKRLTAVLSAVAETLRPSLATRVGFRYVNRLDEPKDLERLGDLVCAELVGVHTDVLQGQIEHASSQIGGVTKEGRLLARWGLTPAGATHDPDMAQPLARPSWLLDIDSFKENAPVEPGFDVAKLVELVDAMANRAYSFFRWSVSDAFLERFKGGEV
ncbi:MAG: TIGR04255 family protein [Pseudomonadota bacterium]